MSLASLASLLIKTFHLLTANYFLPPPLPTSPNPMTHIIIIGGSFAGISTAHRILKQAAKTTTAPFKITLVSRDTHFYWNIAAPRAVMPGQFEDEKLFLPIAEGFEGYPAGAVEVVVAEAVGVDVEGKRVEVCVGGGGGEKRMLGYDFLMLGTGSRSREGMPFKSLGSTEATREALRGLQERVRDAESIVVLGTGPTGVEVAGELSGEYGAAKKIYLFSRAAAVLEGRPASVSQTALKQLQKLNVDVRVSTSIDTITDLPDGRQELATSKGEKVVVDLCIPTYGVQPNSSYVPAQFLDANGFVKVDEYLAVRNAKDIFAIGDVSDAEPPQFWFVDKQSIHLAKNMVLILSGKTPVPYKVSTTGMMGVQIGKKSGTGHFGSFKLPGWLVAMLRKSLFVENLARTVDGSML